MAEEAARPFHGPRAITKKKKNPTSGWKPWQTSIHNPPKPGHRSAVEPPPEPGGLKSTSAPGVSPGRLASVVIMVRCHGRDDFSARGYRDQKGVDLLDQSNLTVQGQGRLVPPFV